MQDWHAFAEFMGSVQDAKGGLSLKAHQEAFFREHSNSTFRLLPSLFRQGARTEDEYWKLERRMFFQFRALARELYTSHTQDWDVLFHMQHHGLPTRLLDWTSVFAVALYFALLDHQADSDAFPCIWLLNPYALNNATWNVFRLFNPKYLARGEEEADRSYDYGEILLGSHPARWGARRLDWETPLAIFPNQRSERMFAQSGWFTIHGTNLASLEESFGHRPDILRKVDLPMAAIPAAKEFLIFAGMGHRKLFPDLDGLAKSIKEQFGIAR